MPIPTKVGFPTHIKGANIFHSISKIPISQSLNRLGYKSECIQSYVVVCISPLSTEVAISGLTGFINRFATM